MKANRISMLVKVVAAALLAVCLNAGHAMAQTEVGTFALPFQTHWGLATLSPGNYSFTLDSVGGQGVLTLRRGLKVVAFIPNQSRQDQKSGRSELIVVRNSDGRFVRELRLPRIGMALRYAPPKSRRNGAVEESEIAEVIPLTIAEK